MAITFAIDISHHQDKRLDLAQTRRDGCELCIMKAGQGATMVDPDFASNLAEAEAAGQLTAAYWFIDSRASAAAHLAKIKQVVPKRVALIPDVESIKDSQGRVISAPSLALTREVIRLVLAEGYRVPLMYLPRWYWQTWGSPSLAGLPPLWSSRYPDMVVGTLADEWADVPASYWDGYGGLSVALLQFTSSARIAGYQPLDASAFRGTRAELAALLNQEDDMPSIDEIVNATIGARANGTPIKLGDALANLYAGAYYGGGDAGPGPVFKAANAANAKLDALTAKVDALAAAVAASTKDPAITLDAMKQVVNDAVAQHIQITGEVHIGPAPTE